LILCDFVTPFGDQIFSHLLMVGVRVRVVVADLLVMVRHLLLVAEQLVRLGLQLLRMRGLLPHESSLAEPEENGITLCAKTNK
jgi:hypothetical protein